MNPTGAKFNRQPAHIILLDLSKPFNHDVLVNFYQSLTDFFSLVIHINGPCPVPLFGLTAIGESSETIYSLQHIKGSFSRLYSVLTEFKRSAMDTTMTTFDSGSFSQGIRDVISQYQRQQQAMRQVAHAPCQLEISVVTCHPANYIAEQINKMEKSLELDILKKIQVVTVAVENGDNLPTSQSTTPENNSPDSETDLMSGMIDMIPLENDRLCFMNFFKTWLKDCGIDRENLHITLPSPLGLMDDDGMNCESNNKSTILKCDLHDTFIDPSNLMCPEYFSLKGDFCHTKSYAQQNNKAMNMGQSSDKVFELKAYSVVKNKGICESVVSMLINNTTNPFLTKLSSSISMVANSQVYGSPIFVRPTCCWKLDWEELDANQMNFNALCKVLFEKDVSLVVKSGSEQVSNNPAPQAFYLVMPSTTSTLLIKSIAVEELMLPADFPPFGEKTSQESTVMIEECLDQLPLQDIYNPYFVTSNLFKFFVSKAIKNNPAPRGKRRFQAPQKSDVYEVAPPKKALSSRGRGQTAVARQQPVKKIPIFDSPRRSKTAPSFSTAPGNSRNTTTITRRGNKALPTVAVLQPNKKTI